MGSGTLELCAASSTVAKSPYHSLTPGTKIQALEPTLKNCSQLATAVLGPLLQLRGFYEKGGSSIQGCLGNR